VRQVFEGERWTQAAGAADKYGLNYIRSIAGRGLSPDPRVIHQGQNGGYQAINLAYHKGAKRVILLGYDMHFSNGQAHWFGDHPNNQRSNYEMFKPHFETIDTSPNFEIINCSRQTALKCFPIVPIEAVLWT